MQAQETGQRWQIPPVAWSMDSPEGLLMGADLMDCLDALLQRMPNKQRAGQHLP
ncbi:MAG: hypothetical protein RLN59_00475 [Haliea sp.]